MNAQTPEARGIRIVSEAARFVALTEILPNRKWDLLTTPGHDAIADELVRVMIAAGWQPDWPYCSAFVEAIWRAAYAEVPKLAAQISDVLTPHCLTSWRNAWAKGWTSVSPVRGAIGIMRKGASDSCHAFIVEQVGSGYVRTIEANTSANAGTVEADRNGDGVYRKTRVLSFTRSAGLYLVGFILPPGA